jgi:hypothetical protein
MAIKAQKGTKDVLPSESWKWQYIESEWAKICAEYGFKELRTPIFEATELFNRGIGDTTDVVQKEMYTFNDLGGRSITLKPEGTSPAVRAFIESNLYAETQPTKVYYNTPCFRYEKPQAGRLREFHQFGIENFGTHSMLADAEIIALGHDWQTPVYTWSDDHMTCTATQECGNDADHTITEVATVTVTKEGGEDVYTATFTNPVFETQTYRNTPSLDITISEFGFLSLYADKAYIVPKGLTAYIYTGMNGKNLVRENIDVIPAYTGVFFSGTPNKTYTLYETETQTTYPTNMLHGYLIDTKVDNPNVHYILSKNVVNGKPGLLWPLGTDKGVGEFTTRGGKAYLEIPVALGVAPRYYTMRGEACDEVTAVDETQVNGDGKYYDILGREVREPQPQQIYIHNGQKILYGE